MTRRKALFWTIFTLIIIFAIAIFAFETVNLKISLPAEIIQPGYYRVLEVYDGDTIAVDMNGTTEKVRMIGVDTPETHKPNTPVQCYGPEASTFTKNLLNDKTVRLEADPTNNNRDRYNRLLRYVYTEQNVLVEQLLIEQGLGFAYLSFPFEKSDQFAALQQQTQKNKLGLWAKCQPALSGGRWLSNSL